MCLSRCLTAAGNKMRLRTTEVQKRRCVVWTNQRTSSGARVHFVLGKSSEHLVILRVRFIHRQSSQSRLRAQTRRLDSLFLARS